MAYPYGQGRDRYDRDDEDFDREYRDDRWERGRQRAESGSPGVYDRGRDDEWNARGYRGASGRAGWREDERDEWERERERERGRGYRGGEQSRYERGGFYGGRSAADRGEMSNARQFDRDWYEGGMSGRGGEHGRQSSRPYRDRDWYESGFGGGTLEGTSGFGPGVGPRSSQRGRSAGGVYATGYYGEYAGYGVAPSDFGPSTGYGYGPAQSYIGDQGQSSAWRRLGQRNFAGRGPKNYKRSDERIREDVNERLTRHPDLDATDVDVRVSNCEVTLMGVVEDRHAKRLAEDIAEDVWGVDDVKNDLKVRHGFLAALTGEKADDRDVTQPAIREGAAGGTVDDASRRAGRSSGSTSGTTTGT